MHKSDLVSWPEAGTSTTRVRWPIGQRSEMVAARLVLGSRPKPVPNYEAHRLLANTIRLLANTIRSA